MSPDHVSYREDNIEYDIELSWDQWTDPGLYPSGAGGGPLPDGPPYVSDVDGIATVWFPWSAVPWFPEEDMELSPCFFDLAEYDSLEQWAEDYLNPRIDGVYGLRWKLLNCSGSRAIFAVAGFEADRQ